MAVKQIKEDKLCSHVLDDDFSEEEVHMGVKDLKEDKLYSFTRQRVFSRRSSHGRKTTKRRQIMFL